MTKKVRFNQLEEIFFTLTSTFSALLFILGVPGKPFLFVLAPVFLSLIFKSFALPSLRESLFGPFILDGTQTLLLKEDPSLQFTPEDNSLMGLIKISKDPETLKRAVKPRKKK